MRAGSEYPEVPVASNIVSRSMPAKEKLSASMSPKTIVRRSEITNHVSQAGWMLNSVSSTCTLVHPTQTRPVRPETLITAKIT